MRNREIMTRFFAFYKPYLSKLIKAAGAMLFASLLQLPLPLLTMYIIDTVIMRKDYQMLTFSCVLLLVVGILKIGSGFILEYFVQYIRQRVMSDIRNRLFNHVVSFPLKSLKQRQTGDLMARILNDITASQGLFADTVINLTRSLLTLIFGVVVIFSLNWKLALVSLVSMPFFVLSILLFSKKIKEISKKNQEKYADASRSLSESLQATEVIKAFSREQKEKVKFYSRINQLVKVRIKMFLIGMTANSLTSLVGVFAPLLVIYYGSLEVMAGHLTIGGIVAFNSFLMYLYNPVQSLIGLNISVQSALGAAERIFELLNEKPEDFFAGRQIEIFKKQIEIKNVSFSYNRCPRCLKNLNFSIYPGEKVAIIGKSGSGKSTFANLLMRFYDLGEDDGDIVIDGVSIKDVSRWSIRDQIGIVQQDTFLFTGSIYDNILYSRKNATREDVIQAARIANIHQFITGLPDGYDTNVGERGLRLSGGERQRIALARIILKAPSIIILDEAMSHLDFENEHIVLNNLFERFEDNTFIIITHRPYLLKNIDRLVVFDNGELVSMGKMNEIFPNFENIIYEEMKEAFYERNLPQQIHGEMY